MQGLLQLSGPDAQQTSQQQLMVVATVCMLLLFVQD